MSAWRSIRTFLGPIFADHAASVAEGDPASTVTVKGDGWEHTMTLGDWQDLYRGMCDGQDAEDDAVSP